MTVGDDIKEVFNELGPAVSVYKHAEDTSHSEHIDYSFEVNRIYPHTSHYIIKALFVYDTVAAPGDLVSFVDDSEITDTFLLTSMMKERFEGNVISKEGVLFLCNSYIDVSRRTETRDDDYNLQTSWPNHVSDELVFFTGQIDDNKIQNKDFADFVIESNLLYVSGNIDIREDDRCTVKQSAEDVSGEVFQVTIVETNRLPNIKMCKVVEDTRE